MPYVKWNATKFHAVNMSGPGGTRTGDGRVTASPVGDGHKIAPAYTMCGRAIPAENEFFEQLPNGVDLHNQVCNACTVGTGLPKMQGPKILQSSEKRMLKSDSDELRERLAASMRDLFT